MALRFLLCATFLFVGIAGIVLALRDDQPDDVWRSQPTIKELNHAAGRSSRNPRLQATVGRFYALDPDIQNFNRAEVELRAAIAAAPADYRLWSALGETLSLAGKLAEAETACRRSVELAPNYFDPLWQLANILFRQGKLTEAAPFARKAIALDDDSAPLMLDLGWQMTNGDQAFMKSLLPERPTVQMQYLKLLVAKKRAGDAVIRWNQFSPDIRNVLLESARDFVRQLISEKEYGAAWDIWASLPEQAPLKPVRGAILDGGFQAKPIQNPCFEWSYDQPKPGVEVRIDPLGPPGRGGALKVIYNAETGVFEHARQIVPLGPGRYRLSYFTRSEQMVTGSPPVVEIRQAGTPQIQRVRSSPSVLGGSEWVENSVEFTVPPTSSAAEIVIFRPMECTAGGPCAIFGRVWFAAFKLEPVSGSGTPRKS